MMKKAMMVLAVLLALPFAMQAQTKFHDVEANDAKGPVKSITQNMMGRTQVVQFTPEGKMQMEGLKDATYDKDGYLQSYTIEAQEFSVTINYTWENGKVKSQSLTMMNQPMKTTNNYDDKGNMQSQIVDMGGQQMTITYKDYQFDAKGNWISRKNDMMQMTNEQSRTIEYYE